MDFSQLLKDNQMLVIIGLSILSLIIILISWWQRKRIAYASMFGKIEHFAGRLLGVLLVATFILEYFKLGYTLIGIISSFICWTVYLIAHTVEKLCYGKGLR